MKDPEPLPGGHLNAVWRLTGSSVTCILKYAPPHIASAPEVPLDPHRIHIEARLLTMLDEGGSLQPVGSGEIRPPRPIYFDAERNLLLMEDIAPHRPLDRVLSDGALISASAGQRLGAFVGRLHGETTGDQQLQEKIDNRPIQETRLEVQYNAIGALLAEYGTTDAEVLGEKAVELGEKYLTPGRCVIMGDLWPRSIMVKDAGESIRLIDWELAHYGRPTQDIAHLAAHWWMMVQRVSSEEAKETLRAAWERFIESYRQAMGDRFAILWDDTEQQDAVIHFGCEVLVRTIGRFREGYLYEGLENGSDPIQQAVEMAVHYLRKPSEADALSPF